MVNRESRDRLALSLRRLASGQITNDKFDHEAFALFCDRRDDPALAELSTFAWMHYSDLYPYRLRGLHALSSEARSSLARAVLFLKTDQEYVFNEFPPDDAVADNALNQKLTILGVMTAVMVVSIAFNLFLVLLSIVLALTIVGLIWAVIVEVLSRVKLRRLLRQHPPLEGTFWPFLDECASQEKYRYWPFATKQAYETALCNPPFLDGRD